MFTSLFEAPEIEAARLAEAPVTSINHSLSLLPVNVVGYVQGLMIQMPRLHPNDKHVVVVVPFERVKPSADEIAAQQLHPRKRHTGIWNCLVVASTNDRYPVGGYHLAISEAQLVRGTVRTLDLTA